MRDYRIFSTSKTHISHRLFIALFVLLGTALGVIGYVYATSTESVPIQGGEYREGVIGSPSIINPLIEQSNDASRTLYLLVYSSLMTYDKQGNLVPDLVQSFQISDNGLLYSFVLKDNVYWSDGELLTAEDVVFTIQLVQDQAYKSPLRENWSNATVSLVDWKTLEVQLPTPYTPFLESTTLPILPKHIWENKSVEEVYDRTNNLTPIGSGMYAIQSFTENESGNITSYTLTKNDVYYNKQPYIPTIVFKFYPDQVALTMAYKEKMVDGFSPVSFSSVQNSLKKNDILYSFTTPQSIAIFFNHNTQSELLQNIKIRQALLFATNKQEIIETILDTTYGTVAHTPIPPSLSDYYFPDNAPAFSVENAEQLLEQQGWSQKNEHGMLVRDTIPLAFTIVVPDTPELTQVASLIQKQWALVGVDLKINTQDPLTVQTQTIPQREYDMILYGETLGSIVDPYPFWHASQKQHPGLNIANLDDPTVNTLLEQARINTNKQNRIEMYNKLQDYFANNALSIFLYEPRSLYVINKRVKNVQTASFITNPSHRFIGIADWYIKTKRTLSL